MNFPYIRHYQRYEYVVNSGYVDDRTVVDLGCGVNGVGPFLLTSRAKFVYAVDSAIDLTKVFGFNDNAHTDRLLVIKGDLFEFEMKVDVAVAIEVIEHMENVDRFVSHVARICNYAFMTTPLVETTGKTGNPVHVLEYSAEDFDRIVGEKFEILDKVYQHGDLSITKEAKPCGDSFDSNHVVQMVWARSRNG